MRISFKIGICQVGYLRMSMFQFHDVRSFHCADVSTSASFVNTQDRRERRKRANVNIEGTWRELSNGRFTTRLANQIWVSDRKEQLVGEVTGLFEGRKERFDIKL